MYASTQKGELTMSEVITMKRNNSDENTTLAMLANDFIRKMSIHKICGYKKPGEKQFLSVLKSIITELKVLYH